MGARRTRVVPVVGKHARRSSQALLTAVDTSAPTVLDSHTGPIAVKGKQNRLCFSFEFLNISSAGHWTSHQLEFLFIFMVSAALWHMLQIQSSSFFNR